MVYVWLNKKDKHWYTTEVDNAQLLELFGTDTLPTPYGHTFPLESVLERLKQKHPERHFAYSKDAPPMRNIFDAKHYATKAELLEVCVLHVLKDCGYFVFDLNKKVERLLDNSHVLTPGTLEPVLKKLVLAQLVSREEKPVPYHGGHAPFYELTLWGAEHLKDKVENL